MWASRCCLRGPSIDTAISRRCFRFATSSRLTGIAASVQHYAQQGVVVNHKKIRRLMREHDLRPRTRSRFVATTDSDHDGPIFPNLARGFVASGPNQLWVSDIS
ncbi:hypothetical protein EOD08_14380 [Mesorhizobium sp. M6A.T.Ca.TU.002.02.2.1]|nr:hypothetical protein EOD08_14380 [Mesorhizobium sp. M6A.T.Ca.TU.002.02.2.1]